VAGILHIGIVRFVPMPDLTLSDLRGLSEKELRRRLREEALKLLGPGEHEGPHSGDLCPVLEKDFLSVKWPFFEKWLSEAKETRRKDPPRDLWNKYLLRNPRASSE
jgi:hypothetical protein